MSSSSSEITVGYWGIRGLGAPLRMMVMFGGASLKVENYDVAYNSDGGFDLSHWFGSKPALKERNALMNLPYVIDGDFVVVQSNACMTYLGRKLGMAGENAQEASQIEQLLCEAYDIRNGIVGFAYGKGGAAGFSGYIAGTTSPNGSVGKLDLWLNRKCNCTVGASTFFVGSKAASADFAIFECLDQLRQMAAFYKEEDPLKNFPFLADFHEKFRALPNNACYFASKLANLPCNNIQAASYGGTPSGAASMPDTDRSAWLSSSGTY